ncbi:MAG: hypothetical protein ABIQ17_03790 [Candidatus Limnocylindrales bacterium]
MGSTRSLLIIGLSLVAIAVLATVVVILGGNRPPAVYPASSPEAAVQDYLQAWADGDDEAAWAVFSAGVQADLTLDDYRTMASEFRRYQEPPSGPIRRVFIDRATITGEKATVDLTVEESWQGGPLERNVYRSARRLSLVREDGAWKIDEQLVWLDPGWYAK